MMYHTRPANEWYTYTVDSTNFELQGIGSGVASNMGMEKPTVMGPLFSRQLDLDFEDEQFEVSRMQRYLLKYGYLAEESRMDRAVVNSLDVIDSPLRGNGGSRHFFNLTISVSNVLHLQRHLLPS